MMRSHALKILAARYRQVWSIDFEFRQPEGERPCPLCMVARDLVSGETVRRWFDDPETRRCPFACDDREAFVTYYAIAEMSCFRVLGWPRPRRVLDCFTEFRNATNGTRPPFGSGLLGALTYFGLPGIGGEEKDSMRALAQRGGPHTAAEREALLAYCETDVDALARLLGPRFDRAGVVDLKL
jgi:hypothetical protein